MSFDTPPCYVDNCAARALRRLRCWRGLILPTILLFTGQASIARTTDAICDERTFEGARFTVCEVDLARHDIRIFLKNAEGTNYSRPEALPQKGLLFATNAGMFRPDYEPAGLFIQNGQWLSPLVTRRGAGNFHLEPNGVFWIANGRAAVSTTAEFAKLKPRAQLATQSGPMLVMMGKLHPKFDINGPSRYIRNGVGVRDSDHVVFAISQTPVSFGVFARLFRDGLSCANALYFDGSVSRLYQPAGGSVGLPGPLGPLIGVYAR